MIYKYFDKNIYIYIKYTNINIDKYKWINIQININKYIYTLSGMIFFKHDIPVLETPAINHDAVSARRDIAAWLGFKIGR
jgi:hypothetical protein